AEASKYCKRQQRRQTCPWAALSRPPVLPSSRSVPERCRWITGKNRPKHFIKHVGTVMKHSRARPPGRHDLVRIDHQTQTRKRHQGREQCLEASRNKADRRNSRSPSTIARSARRQSSQPFFIPRRRRSRYRRSFTKAPPEQGKTSTPSAGEGAGH